MTYTNYFVHFVIWRKIWNDGSKFVSFKLLWFGDELEGVVFKLACSYPRLSFSKSQVVAQDRVRRKLVWARLKLLSNSTFLTIFLLLPRTKRDSTSCDVNCSDWPVGTSVLLWMAELVHYRPPLVGAVVAIFTAEDEQTTEIAFRLILATKADRGVGKRLFQQPPVGRTRFRLITSLYICGYLVSCNWFRRKLTDFR